MKRLQADPGFRARQAAGAREYIKRLHAEPEFVAELAAGASERMSRPYRRTKGRAATRHTEDSRVILTYSPDVQGSIPTRVQAGGLLSVQLGKRETEP